MALVRKSSGDTIGVVDANQQFYDLLTGAMTDQPITLKNFIQCQYNAGGLYPASLGAGAGGAISANFTAGSGEVDFWNVLTGAGQSFRFYQKTGASAATILATLWPSGGLYIGATPVDPGSYAILTDGAIIAKGRLQNNQGADVASTTNLVLGTDGNVFRITGTTNISRLDRTNWQIGSVVTLLFAGALTVLNAQTISGSNLPFVLNGAVNFGPTAADNALTLRLMGNPIGNPLWYEIARKV